jgi:hypothetical protein
MRRAAYCLLVLLALASFSFAQSSAGVGFEMTPTVETVHGSPNGWHNVVNVESRHCADYTSTVGHLWWKHKALTADGWKACQADSTTLYARTIGTNIPTTGGIDAMTGAVFGTATQPAACNYIVLSTDTTAMSAGDCAAGSSSCTVTGEQTTNGLARTKGTYSHTNGTSSFTLTNTFTYSGSTGVTIAKVALFNASSSGTYCYGYVLGSTATVSNSGDTIAVTWSGTVSGT